jgi:hypothetical protein
MSKLSKTPRFKRMYRKGYLFEKKTRAVITSILSQYNNLLHYSIESRGSKGKADIVFGLYHLTTGSRTWFGIQCKKGYISKPQQKREIQSALKENGMIMFFATSSDDRSVPCNFYPSFKQWVDAWMHI